MVLHEFAHQLDAEEGITAGVPLLPKPARPGSLHEMLQQELERLQCDAARCRPTVLDPYGAESPEELFAVATEAFFETPHAFRRHHPAFYEELVRLYRQNPAEWS